MIRILRSEDRLPLPSPSHIPTVREPCTPRPVEDWFWLGSLRRVLLPFDLGLVSTYVSVWKASGATVPYATVEFVDGVARGVVSVYV